MNKPNFLKKIYRGRSLTLIKTSILSFIVIITITMPMRAEGSFDRKEIIHETIQGYIQNGDNQCKEGLYNDAAETYLMAQKYQEFLPEQERTQLQRKIEQTDKAIIEQNKALEIFRSAQDSFKKNKLSETKSLLESIQKNEFLSGIERTELLDMLNEIKTRMDMDGSGITSDSATKTVSSTTTVQSSKPVQTAQNQNTTSESLKKHYADLYEQSKAYEKSGLYEKAREGYIQVLNSGTIDNKLMAEYIQSQITSIDKNIAANKSTYSAANPNVLSSIASEPADNRIIQTQVMDSEPAAAARQDETFLDSVVKERDIIRDYIKTLNTNTVVKVASDINDGNFAQAKYEVQKTQIVINQYQAELGDNLFNNYQMQLNALNDHISTQELVQTQKGEEIKNVQALQEQENIRKSREAEKKQRVKELLASAQENKKLENYDAALGQLKKLLDLDPQNQNALILKEEIEDRQYLGMQVDIEKENNKQTMDLLIQGDEARIPWAELVTYPKNWRDITNRKSRQPEKPFGRDEREEAVYRQLDEIVDLSGLDQFMSVDDVLNAIRNAVDPPLQIQPNWRDLGDIPGIEPTTPADMGPLTNVKLKAALDVLINNLSTTDAPIGYIVNEGIVLIASKDNLPNNMVQRTYDIADLVQMPSQGGGGMMGGMMGGYGGSSMMGGYGGSSMMGGYGGSSMMGGYGGNSYGGGYGGNTGYGGGYGGNSYGGNSYGGNSYGGGYGGNSYGGSSMMGGYGSSSMMGGYGGSSMMGGYGGSSMMGGYGGSSMMGGYGGSSMMGGYGGGMMGGGGNTSGELVNLIQQLIEPDTWYDTSDEGEGTIYPYPQASPKKLTVTNTPEVHAQIEKLLESLRKSLGHQVSIEARILSVSENWLNDVGLDMDFSINAGGKFGMLEFQQGSFVGAAPEDTKVTGSLAAAPAAMGVAGGYGSILDDIQVSFLIKATQARTDVKSLVAPRATVLDGETAMFSNQSEVSYVPPPRSTTTVTPTGIGTAATSTDYSADVQSMTVGVPLNITPTISHDKRYVLVNLQFTFQDLLRLRTHSFDYITDGDVQSVQTTVPEIATTQVNTRVSIPDGGTLLLGGQTISMEVSKESGVPILSKIPIINRFFMNRSYIKDQQIMLVLVKPTIILQEESEAEALGEMESLY